MKAKQLVEALGKELIGKTVMTEVYGGWPGGLAVVYALSLDAGAPEIVCNVRNAEGAEIGIFEWENLEVRHQDALFLFAAHVRQCPHCAGRDDGCEVGQFLEQSALTIP